MARRARTHLCRSRVSVPNVHRACDLDGGGYTAQGQLGSPVMFLKRSPPDQMPTGTSTVGFGPAAPNDNPEVSLISHSCLKSPRPGSFGSCPLPFEDKV